MVPMISVVLPVYNERENLEALLMRLMRVLERIADGSFEVLFVDDGSRDGSAEIIQSFRDRDHRVKVIHFSRNFGHQAALQAGLDEAKGLEVRVAIPGVDVRRQLARGELARGHLDRALLFGQGG